MINRFRLGLLKNNNINSNKIGDDSMDNKTSNEDKLHKIEYRVSVLEKDSERQYRATTETLEHISTQLNEITVYMRDTYAESKVTERALKEHVHDIARLENELKESKIELHEEIISVDQAQRKWLYGVVMAVFSVVAAQLLILH